MGVRFIRGMAVAMLMIMPVVTMTMSFSQPIRRIICTITLSAAVAKGIIQFILGRAVVAYVCIRMPGLRGRVCSSMIFAVLSAIHPALLNEQTLQHGQ